MSTRIRTVPMGWLMAAALLAAGSAQAALGGYTTRASFLAASAADSAVQTVDFDAVPTGTTFASGSGTGGLSFSYNIAPGVLLKVSSLFATTSGTRYLGLNNGNDAFLLGDGFTINFGRTVHAVGLYLITGGGVLAGDFRLTAAAGSVGNSAMADRTVADGSPAYFLGLVESDPGAGFSSVTLGSLAGPLIVFNVDDITSAVLAVPEPSTLALMLAGAGLLALRRRRSTAAVTLAPATASPESLP